MKKLTELKVIVAEDEHLNYLLIEFLMKGKVKSIIHAQNGIEAVELVKKDKYDLVLMDINMPVMGGIEAAEIIKTIDPEMVIIVQSAYATPAEIAKAMETGCNDFISKPLNKKNLLEIIEMNFSSKYVSETFAAQLANP